MNNKRRMISALLAIMMILQILTIPASVSFAETNPQPNDLETKLEVQDPLGSGEIIPTKASVEEAVEEVLRIPRAELEVKKMVYILHGGKIVDGPAREGDVLLYGVSVLNSGEVDISDVYLSDSLVPSVNRNLGDLAMGESQFIDYVYSVTQADLDRGDYIVNSVRVEAPDPNNPSERISFEDSTSVAIQAKTERLEVVKTVVIKRQGVTVEGPARLGDVLEYSVKVKNTGGRDIPRVFLYDSVVPSVNVLLGYMAIGESKTSDYSYTINYENLKRGSTIVNRAMAIFSYPNNPNDFVSFEDSVTVAIEEHAAEIESKLEVKKNVFIYRDGLWVNEPARLGDQLYYEVIVHNNGGTVLRDIDFYDTLLPAFNQTIEEMGISVWRPVNYDYVITQADMDRGENIVNTARVEAVDPLDPEKIIKAQATAIVTLEKDPEVLDPDLEVKKSFKIRRGNASVVEPAQIGDIIDYTVEVRNSGEADLFNVEISDTLVPSVDQNLAELAVGEVKAFSYSYTITQADLDKGDSIENTAKAQSAHPSSPGEIVKAQDTARVAVEEAKENLVAGLEVEKSFQIRRGDRIVGEPALIGDFIDYSVEVRNIGESDLSNVEVSDTLAPAIDQNLGLMVSGEKRTLHYTYTISQADLDKGDSIENMAKAEAVDPNNTDKKISGEDTVKIRLGKWRPALTILKEANRDEVSAGENITYTITVTNSGDAEAVNVKVKEDLPSNAILISAAGTSMGDFNPSTSIWSIEKIGAGESAALSLTVKVKDDVLNGAKITNVVTIKEEAGKSMEGESSSTAKTETLVKNQKEKPGQALPSTGESSSNYLFISLILLLLSMVIGKRIKRA